MNSTNIPKYFGDGEDTFSQTEWERELWSLLRKTYEKKISESTPSNPFSAPDYETIVECEEILRSRGIKQTFRA